ncbi:MAG: hypothetical protein JWR80_898 [Bradyrhizobium sp.]|nr:hypothetical protein [Bradyrhizobium sp.]
MASAAVSPPQSGFPSLSRIALAAALVTILQASRPALAQSMEERARTAAQASRAKTSDSDALRQNYITPGLAGQPIATIDNSQRFNPNISCQKSATLMEVLIQPSATGDIGTIQIARDTDLDGTVDNRVTLPVAVSGICANGVIACTPGTWTQCHYLRWDTDSARNLKLTEGQMGELAGCYCINNSCGTNLVWANLPSVLGDLGGGMIGALTSADPRIGVAQAVIDGPVIRYVGARTTACAADQALPQSAYQANAGTLSGDASAASAGNHVFQLLASSPAGLGKAQQLRHCTIERQATVVKPGLADIIDRTAGGYGTVASGTAVDFYVGSPVDNSVNSPGCGLIDFRMTLHVGAAQRILDARLAHLAGDDWAQLRVDGVLVASGEDVWTGNDVPPGTCEKKRTFHASPDVDLKPFLTPGDHEIWFRLAVSNGGDGYAQVHIETDGGCQSTEQLIDQCASIAGDSKCHLDTEFVDGVQTFRAGIKTGLTPLPQTRILGADACAVTVTRDFFLRDRTYACALDSSAFPEPDLSRGAYIIDHSTETLLADRSRQSDGTIIESTRPFSLPERGSVPACEPVCKTRAPVTNTAAAPAGVVGAQQNVPTSWDTFYHACTTDTVCPLGQGEEIVSACGCLDDFPEAVAMMQTVRLAGSDMVCTSETR